MLLRALSAAHLPEFSVSPESARTRLTPFVSRLQISNTPRMFTATVTVTWESCTFEFGWKISGRQCFRSVERCAGAIDLCNLPLRTRQTSSVILRGCSQPLWGAIVHEMPNQASDISISRQSV